jgi:hypothetical protein
MQLMTQLSLPAIIAGSLMTTFAILVNLLYFIMIGKVNERVPKSERISYLRWGTEVRKKFKQIYPGNKLVLLLDSCVVLMVLSFVFLIRVWVFG